MSYFWQNWVFCLDIIILLYYRYPYRRRSKIPANIMLLRSSFERAKIIKQTCTLPATLHIICFECSLLFLLTSCLVKFTQIMSWLPGFALIPSPNVVVWNEWIKKMFWIWKPVSNVFWYKQRFYTCHWAMGHLSDHLSNYLLTFLP